MNVRLDTAQVHVDLERFDEPLLMGSLRYQPGGSGDIFSFEYDDAWLRRSAALAFDPDLALVPGPLYPTAGRANFGIFLDSSPDRWGRVLMQRRENIRARREGRRPRFLTEWAFLLGVHDETAIGCAALSGAGRRLHRPRRSSRRAAAHVGARASGCKSSIRTTYR